MQLAQHMCPDGSRLFFPAHTPFSIWISPRKYQAHKMSNKTFFRFLSFLSCNKCAICSLMYFRTQMRRRRRLLGAVPFPGADIQLPVSSRQPSTTNFYSILFKIDPKSRWTCAKHAQKSTIVETAQTRQVVRFFRLVGLPTRELHTPRSARFDKWPL